MFLIISLLFKIVVNEPEAVAALVKWAYYKKWNSGPLGLLNQNLHFYNIPNVLVTQSKLKGT